MNFTVTKKGIFVCIEGLDGSGKTTHAHRLVQNLQKRGVDAVYTTEPGQGAIGKFIRESVLQGERRVPGVVEAVLFAADRVEHMEEEVKPALREGKVVVSDRCVYSSLAYQGAAGLDLEWIKEINRFALPPDLALYIDVPPEVVVKRIRRKKSVMETLETQRRVKQVYMKFVDNRKLMSIDGDRKKSQVEQNILKVILDFLKNHNSS
ncbi:MAG TPA: dTMP kinase [Candidatus Bathyarchaeota archaeon]|nr:dTMP kinase [Candidatus Bathyarchaeota archaeon]